VKRSALLLSLLAASAIAVVAAPVLFHKGVNLTGWLQGKEVGSVVPGAYTEQDFRGIRALGCDMIRPWRHPAGGLEADGPAIFAPARPRSSTRSSTKPVPFDVRFLMPFDPAGGSLPWRTSVTVKPADAPWDGQWHEPGGLFDWRRVAGLEVVAEHAGLQVRVSPGGAWP
jgi:hypothetical protein